MMNVRDQLLAVLYAITAGVAIEGFKRFSPRLRRFLTKDVVVTITAVDENGNTASVPITIEGGAKRWTRRS